MGRWSFWLGSEDLRWRVRMGLGERDLAIRASDMATNTKADLKYHDTLWKSRGHEGSGGQRQGHER